MGKTSEGITRKNKPQISEEGTSYIGKCRKPPRGSHAQRTDGLSYLPCVGGAVVITHGCVALVDSCVVFLPGARYTSFLCRAIYFFGGPPVPEGESFLSHGGDMAGNFFHPGARVQLRISTLMLSKRALFVLCLPHVYKNEILYTCLAFIRLHNLVVPSNPHLHKPLRIWCINLYILYT